MKLGKFFSIMSNGSIYFNQINIVIIIHPKTDLKIIGFSRCKDSRDTSRISS